MRRLLLYPLREVAGEVVPGEFPVGAVAYSAGEGVVVDCPDRELAQRLHELFFKPLQVRVCRDAGRSVLAHAWEELSPGTPEHYQEALYRLRQLGVVVR